MDTIVLDSMSLPVVKTTEEGYLKGEASVSKVGVFKYTNSDGSIRYELRHPDDVFATESLNTLKNIPITFNHPEGYEFVNSTNASKLMGGMTGDNVYIADDRLINVNLAITDGDMISKIKKHGIKELSMGYTRDLVPEKGVYDGKEYTHRQKNIKYNHLAIVASGRAGREVRLITMDGVDYECSQSEIINDNEETSIMNEKELTKIIDRLDNIENVMKIAKDSEYETKLSTANATIDTLKGEIDALQTKLSAAVTDSSDEAIISQKVKERVDIMVKAKSVIALDNADDLSNRDIMEAVIKSTVKDGLDLSDKSNDYIAGRFDTLTNLAPKNASNQMAHSVNISKPVKSLADAKRDIYNKYKNKR